jgi:nucleotide-binding universal stress UspA family protein
MSHRRALMYTRILVPTDGSSAAAHAVTHALNLAEELGATLNVLYVVEEHGLRDRLQGIDKIEAELEAHGRRAVDSVAERATERGLSVETFIRHGTAYDEIVQFAADHDVDMIVMGTQGRTGLDRALMGSVSDHVVRLSSVPVVTVRLSDHEQSVKRPEQATEIAREKLVATGYEDVSFPESPSRQRSTWVVRAEADDRVFNVHIDSASGEAHLVPIDRA